jgi:hypothetical protein
MFHFSNIVRTKGDPKIVEGGASLKQPVDQLARALGWFSIGLGVVELFAPRRVTETLGMEGHETLVRSFGIREIMAGIMNLSVEKNAGLWARVVGSHFLASRPFRIGQGYRTWERLVDPTGKLGVRFSLSLADTGYLPKAPRMATLSAAGRRQLQVRNAGASQLPSAPCPR